MEFSLQELILLVIRLAKNISKQIARTSGNLELVDIIWQPLNLLKTLGVDSDIVFVSTQEQRKKKLCEKPFGAKMKKKWEGKFIDHSVAIKVRLCHYILQY